MADGTPPDRAPGGLLTLYEAAEQLGVHYMTVYRYVRTGRLPGHKVGAEWRSDPDDLATFVRLAATSPPPASDLDPTRGSTSASTGGATAGSSPADRADCTIVHEPRSSPATRRSTSRRL